MLWLRRDFHRVGASTVDSIVGHRAFLAALSPSSVAIDAQGQVYVGDEGTSRVLKFSPHGTLLAQWGHQGTGPGQFSGFLFVASDRGGHIHVADNGNNTIQKFSAQGRLLAVWR
jgi:DNA-binding beta-propeller fold protein YncE